VDVFDAATWNMFKLIDDALRGRVHAGSGDRIEPMLQLGVEIIEITKGAAEGKVLADVTERPFHFAFGLRPVRPASAWLEAIVPGEIDTRTILDDEAVGILADDRGLHAIIENTSRHNRTAVRRRLQPPGNGATHGFPIDAPLAGNGGNRQALSMKIQNHHEFPEFDHRAAPSRQKERAAIRARSAAS
jgi:hypothetical protein